MTTSKTSNGGSKFDNGKPRVDLVPTGAIRGVAEVLTFGAEKYDAHNWRKGIAYSRLYAAAQRHLMAYWEGEDTDPESGKSHLYHAITNIIFMSEMPAKFDDRWAKGEETDE
jgi:hypothetical protein